MGVGAERKIRFLWQIHQEARGECREASVGMASASLCHLDRSSITRVLGIASGFLIINCWKQIMLSIRPQLESQISVRRLPKGISRPASAPAEFNFPGAQPCLSPPQPAARATMMPISLTPAEASTVFLGLNDNLFKNSA